MRTKNLLYSWFLVMLFCMMGTSSAWADETYTIGWGTASGTAFTNFDAISGSVDGILSFSAEKNSSSTNPAYNSNSSELRLYYNNGGNGGSITLTPAEGVTITGFVMKTSTAPTVGYSVDGGDAISISASSNTYTVSDISASSSLKIQNVNTTNTQLRIKTIEITYTTGGGGGGGSSAVATTTTIDATGITNTDIYSGTAAGSLSATVVDADDNAVEGATVTWSGNNDEVATIDASTGVVTLVAAGTVTFTATYAGVTDEYKASSDTYELTVTDSTPIPTHTATFSVNGETSTQEFEEGADIEFPENPADVSGKTFVGWVAEAIEGTTNEAPTFVTSATMGQSDITYYAVFAYASGSGSSEVVDVLNRTWTEATGTSYMDWSDKTATSSAVYAGNSAGGNSSIQLRSNNSNSGIVTTTSGGKVKKVVISWNSNTTSGRTVNVYGKNSAYSNAGDLYNSSSQGDLLGTIVCGTSTELTIDSDYEYEYVGLRSAGSALYLDEVSITWSTGGGASYSDYCTTVVAAVVERPTIEVAANPFTFSTTATITCETEGAAIKYSFDGENWNDYEDALTITETTTLSAKAVKEEAESTVASVEITKNLAVPTVAIDATGITNTNVFDGTEAGSLAASVTYNEAAVEGATVTWSGDNNEVATIDAETGAVTLVAAGTVTFTATYAGNSDYAEKTATYQMTVTNSDPNGPGTENNPYTVADAITFIGTLGSATSATEVYVSGIISQVDSYNSKYGSITYWISDDGTTEGQMEVYSGKGIDGANFDSVDDLQVGDIVTVKGYVKMYNTTPEFDKNNQLVSFMRVEKPATPTFSIAEGIYTEAQSVELSTTTEGAVIYYTVDGTEPTAESIEYTSAIDVAETTTIKAIAVKDDVASDVATATYTINVAPFITVDQTAINVEAAGDEGSIEVTYNNMPQDEFVAEVVYCDAEGNDASYDWFIASINDETNNIDYLVSENTSTEARTAYIKVYAIYDDDYFSDIITFTQAGMVVDYATLPFSYNGNGQELPTGMTASGLGTYTTFPKMKFDSTGDNLVLKINEVPGTLSFDIKGNSLDGNGTFTVQTSADGESYTNLKVYDYVDSKTTETIELAADVRYIKWVYTEKSAGNFALGNINLTKDVNITVSAAGYATYCSDKALDFSHTPDLKAYIVTSDGTSTDYTEVTSAPANTGLLLKGIKGEATNFTAYVIGNSDTYTADNKLVGVNENTHIDATTNGKTNFVLQNQVKYGVGFYKVTSEGFNVRANSAYLSVELSSGSGARSFFALPEAGSETTGINSIDNGQLTIDNEAVYDLQGRKVQNPKRGLYIMNGKKVMVK